MNLAPTELLVGALIATGLLVLWIIGVVKLFQKNHQVLGWIAIGGIIFPIIALVGYAGWFISPNPDCKR